MHNEDPGHICLVAAAAVVVGFLYFHLLQYQTMVVGGMHNFPPPFHFKTTKFLKLFLSFFSFLL